MGRHLGKLGTPRAERTETFDYLDVPGLRVHPDLTDLLLIDFMARASAIDEDDEPAAMAAMREFFATLVHPDDFAAFWAAALRGRQRVADLLATVRELVEGLAERPTRRRPASSAGRRTTGQKSREDSSLQVMRRLERQGRPDLALVVSQARAARRAG